MSKKHVIKTIEGVKVAVPIVKDHNRTLMPPPTSVHKSQKDYDRQKAKKDLRKIMNGDS